MGEIFLVLFLISVGLGYQILYSFNCGSQTHIKTPLIDYNSDEMYEGLASKSHKKNAFTPKYKDPADIELLTYERTTNQDAFSYFLRLTGADHYYLLMKFIEVVHDKPRQRVFEAKLGDQTLFEIDIVKQVGVGQMLNKWVQFELVDDVLYLNQTMPVLNGYIYPKQTIQFTLSKIIGEPKIQALILLKGVGSEKFIKEYLQFQKSKLNRREESTAQKYQKPPTFPYMHMTGRESFYLPDNSFVYYVDKVLSMNTLLSILAVSFVVLHERIYQQLNIPKDEIKDQ